MVVLGSSEMVHQSVLNATAVANAEYIVGAFNTLCGRSDLFVLTAKTLGGGYLSMSDAQVQVLLAFSVGLIPLLTLGLGVYTHLRRRHL